MAIYYLTADKNLILKSNVDKVEMLRFGDKFFVYISANNSSYSLNTINSIEEFTKLLENITRRNIHV